jgi:hypothetical protein
VTLLLWLGGVQNAINFYAQTVLKDAGFSSKDSYTNSIWIGLVKVVMIAFTMLIIDKFGRKTLCIVGSLGMAVRHRRLQYYRRCRLPLTGLCGCCVPCAGELVHSRVDFANESTPRRAASSRLGIGDLAVRVHGILR